jgi:hypothetical protein
MTPRQTQIAAPGDYIRPTMCVPFDKNHLVKEDNTPYISSSGGSEGASGENSAGATAAADKAKVPNVAGSWNVQIYSSIEGVVNQKWAIKQDGTKFTGTVMAKNGELPLEGKLDGAFLEATVTDGQKKYNVRATVVAKDIDGTIKMNRNEFRFAAKENQ